jgi:hypothetical protein
MQAQGKPYQKQGEGRYLPIPMTNSHLTEKEDESLYSESES